MANTTFYERGNAYHDSSGNPAIIKNGNELTFTEHFNAGGGGGGTPYTPPAYSTDEVDTGKKWLDNKPIYEKVVPVSLTTVEDVSTIVARGYSFVETLIHSTFIAIKANNRGCEANCAYVNADGELKIHNLERWTELTSAYVIIQYTKATAPTLTTTRTSKKKG